MNRRLWFSLWTSALVLVSVFASFPTRAQTDPSAPVLDGAISFSGRRNIPNLSLLGARKERADEEEATHEGRGYWKARREWEMQESAELPAAPILRSVSEAIYRERLRYRSQDGGPQPLNATLAAAGWKSLGPTTDAGRVRDYAFTRDGSKLYAATANGGIWLLTRQGGAGSDYGNPVNLTDDLPLLTFGAVAVAPSNPSIVYAATGEQSPLSGSQVTGMGTLRSTDGGSTWSFNTSSVTGGWFDVVPSQYSYDLDVHPSNPDDVLLGTANGIFRSTDGGRTWVNRLPSTGASSTSLAGAPAAGREPGAQPGESQRRLGRPLGWPRALSGRRRDLAGPLRRHRPAGRLRRPADPFPRRDRPLQPQPALLARRGL
ncbi:MAG: hypothetical protein IPF66_14945 [Holophagales bacterium]|nr:hypothetical protein [Holophagales bacterium]